MKVRFQFQSIEALTPGANQVVRVPINCWRLTVVLSGPRGRMLVDGQNFETTLQPGGIGPNTLLTQFQLGGVFHPVTGEPVNLDQILTFSPLAGGFGVGAQCILVYEYIDP